MIQISAFLAKQLRSLTGSGSSPDTTARERAAFASPDLRDERLPMRRAALVWLGFALAGWVTVVVSAYSVMRFGDTVVAGVQEMFNPTAQTAEEEEGLSDIAPAAGPAAD
jgi:hypothetical protein